MSLQSQSRNGAGFYMVVLVGVFLIMLFMVRSMMETHAPPPLDEERATKRKEQLEKNRAKETETLGTYAWQDEEKGFVRLTIEKAMELTVTEAADPATARKEILTRLEKATAVAPAAPEAPSEYE